DSAKLECARELWTRYPPSPDDDQGVLKVLRTGEPEVFFRVTDELLVLGARDEEHLRLLRTLAPRSVMIVPLNARGHTLGAMTLVMAESSRRYNEEDLRVALELGSRAAMAVENARLFEGVQSASRRQEEVVRRHRSMEEQLTLLVEASGSLSASLDLESV